MDHILSLNKTDIQVQSGNFSSWMENFERQQSFEAARNENLQKEIRRLRQTAKQVSAWSDQAEVGKNLAFSLRIKSGQRLCWHKAAKMMKRSKSIENRRNAAAEEKKKLLKNVEHTEELKLYPLTHHKQCLVAMEDVTLAYGNHEVCRGWDLKICQNERILLQGPNGCGKSSILKAVLDTGWKKTPVERTREGRKPG